MHLNSETVEYALLNAIPSPLLVVGKENNINFANHAAEQFFGTTSLRDKSLTSCIEPDAPLFALLHKAQQERMLVKEYAHLIAGPRLAATQVNLQISPFPAEDELLLMLDECSQLARLEQQILRRKNMRAASMMAAMLAHEIKNPLSGIKGAAQLLESTATGEDRKLAALIYQEVERIATLLQQIDLFSDQPTVHGDAVNIHEVLHYVKDIAAQGFARGIRIVEQYDPSLPPVSGNRASLIQLFLNLVKNAAEALEEREAGEITLITAYESGYKMRLPGSEQPVPLPIAVTVQDNGPGLPEGLRDSAFNPFVSARPGGKGLGLAIVAKLAADHGGAIELLPTLPTRFKVMLPAGS